MVETDGRFIVEESLKQMSFTSRAVKNVEIYGGENR